MTNTAKQIIRIAAVIGTFALAYLALSYAFTPNALAATLAQQAVHNAGDADDVPVVQTFKALQSGNVDIINLRYSLDGPLTATTTVSIWNDNNPANGITGLLGTATSTRTTSAFVSTDAEVEVDFNGTVSLVAGNTYTITATYNTNGAAPERFVMNTTSDTYTDGIGWWNGVPGATLTSSGYVSMFGTNTGYWGGGGNPGYDYFFQIEDALGASLASVSFLYPSAGQSTPNFDAFKFHVDGIDTGLYPYWEASVFWNTTSTILYQKRAQDGRSPSANFNSYITNYPAIDEGTYYAKLFLWGKSTSTISATPPLADAIASSSIISFTVTEGQTVKVMDTNTDTNNLLNINDDKPVISERDCTSGGTLFSDAWLSVVGCYIAKAGEGVLKFAFDPGEDSTAFIGSRFEEFQTVFPFNVFFDINNAVAEAVEAGPGSSGTLSAEMFGHTFVFLSSSTLTNVVGTEAKNNIFGTITAIVWVLVGWVMYKQIA